MRLRLVRHATYRPAVIAYAVCTTPRAGGERLDADLRGFGYGHPDVYLHPDTVAELVAEWGIDHRDYLPELWRRRSPDDCFGVRFHWTHLFESDQANDWRDALPTPTAGKYVLFTREDRDAQARSIQTGDVEMPEREVMFWSERFAVWNAEWLYWFERNRIKYLHVTYEQYAKAPSATLAEIVSYVSL